MGVPSLVPASLPATVDGDGPVTGLPLTVDGVNLSLTLVGVGNPHTIHYIDYSPRDFPLEHQALVFLMFPKRVNFGLWCSPSQVFTSGSGRQRHHPGVGASASAVCVGSLLNNTGNRIIDHMPGSDLELEWDGKGSVFMTGPAVRVFDGDWLE